MAEPGVKKNSKKKWAIGVTTIIALQMGAFYGLELYLTPTVTSVLATAASQTTEVSKALPEIQPPDDAVYYDIEKKGNRIAIFDSLGYLTIKDREGYEIASEKLSGIHFLKWTDRGSTVFYIRKVGESNEVGVYKVNEDMVMPLHVIPSGNVTIEKVFSSYSQTIYTVYKQDNRTYVASFEAIFGWKARSLDDVNVKYVSLNEKDGFLYIEDTSGQIRKFANGKFIDEKEPPQLANSKPKLGTGQQSSGQPHLKP